jgi:ribulose-5-phosphate 4-epimerase/fuculose-1-phosphate aldolase
MPFVTKSTFSGKLPSVDCPSMEMGCGIGATLAEAFQIASEVETLAAMYLTALAVGEPVLLTAEEMADVLLRFARYGTASTR